MSAQSPNKKLSPRESPTNKRTDKNKEEDKSFIAVRWPSTLRKPLKVAAAGSDPPLTMTEYLAQCFNEIQDEGGLSERQRRSTSGTATAILRRNDKEQRRRYQEASEKLFKTHDRRLIDLIILLLGYATR